MRCGQHTLEGDNGVVGAEVDLGFVSGGVVASFVPDQASLDQAGQVALHDGEVQVGPVDDSGFPDTRL